MTIRVPDGVTNSTSAKRTSMTCPDFEPRRDPRFRVDIRRAYLACSDFGKEPNFTTLTKNQIGRTIIRA